MLYKMIFHITLWQIKKIEENSRGPIKPRWVKDIHAANRLAHILHNRTPPKTTHSLQILFEQHGQESN